MSRGQVPQYTSTQKKPQFTIQKLENSCVCSSLASERGAAMGQLTPHCRFGNRCPGKSA